MSEPTMEDVLTDVLRGRAHLICALDALEKRSDREPRVVETLRGTVGDLAALANNWQRERDRWR